MNNQKEINLMKIVCDLVEYNSGATQYFDFVIRDRRFSGSIVVRVEQTTIKEKTE
jgi:hypothetical protein